MKVAFHLDFRITSDVKAISFIVLISEILYDLYFRGLEYTLENHKIVTINMEISKFSKTQS